MVVQESCNVRQREDIQDGTRALTHRRRRIASKHVAAAAAAWDRRLPFLVVGWYCCGQYPHCTVVHTDWWYFCSVRRLAKERRDSDCSTGKGSMLHIGRLSNSGSAFIGSHSTMFRTRKRSFRKICLEFRLNTNCCTNHSE